MIKFVKGDFFEYEADFRVNTVNCVGVMGAGVALSFKKKYPDMFKEYSKVCKKGEISPSNPHVWTNGDMFNKGVTIINLPTKKHWRNPSEYEYIQDGLEWLREYLSEYDESYTITLPALGCGHGGLDWGKVREMIITELKDLNIKILVFEPISSRESPKLNEVDFEKYSKLLSLGIKKVTSKSREYPELLKQWGDRDLFVKGKISSSLSYDIALISSSQPDKIESDIVERIIESKKFKGKSFIFGPSSFERKIVQKLAKVSSDIGMSLPSGIAENQKDIKNNYDQDVVTIFSLGDPYMKFDRKNFIPATLLRLYLSNIIIVTTPSIAWILKQKKHFFRNNAVYFFAHISQDSETQKKLVDLGAVPIQKIDDILV